MKSMEDLFCSLLQSVYSAEKQRATMLETFAGISEAAPMKEALAIHRFQTQQQIAELERVFEIVGRRARPTHCDVIPGMIAEGEFAARRAASGPIRDAALLEVARAALRYQIARYEALLGWGVRLGDRQVTDLLRQNLEEIRKADRRFGSVLAAAEAYAVRAA